MLMKPLNITSSSHFYPFLLFTVLPMLALVAAVLWLPSAGAAQAQAPAAQTVPADWEYVPSGAGPGDSFRLLFVTSATRDASSADIADYNTFVQNAASGDSSLKPFKDGFTALISTAAVNIKDNSDTTGEGVPVHWLGGAKVADDYADLYDLSWDSVSGKTETGGSYTGLVWTGGNGRGETSLRSYAGAAQVRMADLGEARPLSSPTTKASSESYPLYALSPVISVAEPEPTPTPTPEPDPTPTPTPEPARQEQQQQRQSESPEITDGPVITSSPASGDTYDKDEYIVVAVTFSEAVTVTGDVRMRLDIGERQRWAQYARSRQDGAMLVFAYKVKKVDADPDGVSIEANQLKLKGGSIADADGNAATRNHPALSDQSGHKVNGSLEQEITEPEPEPEPVPESPPQSTPQRQVISLPQITAAPTLTADPVRQAVETRAGRDLDGARCHRYDDHGVPCRVPQEGRRIHAVDASVRSQRARDHHHHPEEPGGRGDLRGAGAGGGQGAGTGGMVTHRRGNDQQAAADDQHNHRRWRFCSGQHKSDRPLNLEFVH